MTESDLQKKLQDLHDEIGKTETNNPEKQATLNELQSLIQQAIEQPEDHHKRSLRERLSDSLLEFEVEHPSLTGNMERVCEHLSSLGI
jgi:predicted transcriptional regulator